MHSRRFSDARVHLDEALSLNHNDTITRGMRALLNCYTRRCDDAFSNIEDAIRRDPYAADWHWDVRGTIMMAGGQYHEAVSSYEKSKYVPQWGLAHLAICFVQLGEAGQAASTYRKLLEQHSDWLGGRWITDPSVMFEAFEQQPDIDRFVVAFRRAADLASGSSA
jgi:tetratricopeptide (TPR) repeat protein